MAHYTSDSHLWSERQFLGSSRLERIILLYLMHGQGRTNVPGLSEDSAVTIADRLEEPVEEIKEALGRLSERKIVEVDPDKRIVRCELAARMDPYSGSKTLRGWHKNWQHLPASPLKFDHIATLREKVNPTEPNQVLVWNETFGTECSGRYALSGPTAPVQQGFSFPEPPKKGRGRPPKPKPDRFERVELPDRHSVVHMTAAEYVQKYSADLLTAGNVQEMGGNSDTFALAMHELLRAPEHTGRVKRAAEWDQFAMQFLEATLFKFKVQPGGAHTHEDDRRGSDHTPRTTRPRDRGARENNSQGKWSELLRQKAAETALAPDT